MVHVRTSMVSPNTIDTPRISHDNNNNNNNNRRSSIENPVQLGAQEQQIPSINFSSSLKKELYKKNKIRKEGAVTKHRLIKKVETESTKNVIGAILTGTIAGSLLVTQNGINSSLRNEILISPWYSALLSFIIGMFIMFGIAHFHRMGQEPKVKSQWKEFILLITSKNVHWTCFMGGFLGPIYVVSAVYLTKVLSFSIFQNCAVLGNLLSSCYCDYVGLLGIKIQIPTNTRW